MYFFSGKFGDMTKYIVRERGGERSFILPKLEHHDTSIVESNFILSYRQPDNISNNVRTRGSLATTVHEAVCDSSKNSDQVYICVSCNRIKNLSYL
jgi:hypothetical protein